MHSMPSSNTDEDKIKKYFKRDRSYFSKDQKKDRLIKYDFQDPVLNKEIRETMIYSNQMSYRMRSNPSYAKKVVSWLNSYYNQEMPRNNLMMSMSPNNSTQHGSALKENQHGEINNSSLFNSVDLLCLPMTPEGEPNNSSLSF